MSSVSVVRLWDARKGSLHLMGMVLCATGWPSMRSNRSAQQRSTCWDPLADAKLAQWLV